MSVLRASESKQRLKITERKEQLLSPRTHRIAPLPSQSRSSSAYPLRIFQADSVSPCHSFKLYSTMGLQSPTPQKRAQRDSSTASWLVISDHCASAMSEKKTLRFDERSDEEHFDDRFSREKKKKNLIDSIEPRWMLC